MLPTSPYNAHTQLTIIVSLSL